MPEAKDDLKREKVRIVPISNIEDYPDHAHRGLLSQKYHCSAPLSSPAADAVYRSVRRHG